MILLFQWRLYVLPWRFAEWKCIDTIIWVWKQTTSRNWVQGSDNMVNRLRKPHFVQSHEIDARVSIFDIVLSVLRYLLWRQWLKDYLTTWSIVLLEKLLVFQLVKKFPPFMEPKGSLPSLQESATGSVLSQLHPAHTFPHYLHKIHSNIILLPTPRSSDRNFVWITHQSHACYMTRPSLIWSPHPHHFNWSWFCRRFALYQISN
jgi:hypothetical protein